ncbi:Ig-like domain-containing protein [Mycolicibacterium sp. 120270]|uniref:Ig-like domain-containing protein n=1 Tax=Mycolicibacterium sp. 120270 TaxID=3090600 RepID=UPI00299E3D5D|nr:Ig-like domain-containing protein [Mycolicibacterium sp. 120270]MDX1882093.1 Ig-like domain-containing protein [Mycolicibacterium sp. 120270]
MTKPDGDPAEVRTVQKSLAKGSEIGSSVPLHQSRGAITPTKADLEVAPVRHPVESRMSTTGRSAPLTRLEGPTADTFRTTTADTIRTATVVTAPLVTPISAYPPQLRAPVTLRSMVTDVYRWVGLGPLNVNVPVPATPVPHIVEQLWIGLRRVEYTFANRYPRATPTQGAQTPPGGLTATTGVLDVTVKGSLNAVDPDGDRLTYTVVTEPTNGSVVVNPDGTYTYSADPTFAHTGGKDSFTVRIDDATENPWHIHGLAELFGRRGPTTVTVPVTVAAVNRAPIAPSTITAPAPGADGKVIGSIGASDPDLDPLTYSIYKDPIVVDPRPKGEATIDPATGIYTYTPATWARHEASVDGASPMTDVFYVTTTDSYGASVRTAVSVTIEPYNQDPTASPQVTRDPAHLYDVIVTSFTPGPVWSQITASTAVLLITPNVDDADPYEIVTVTATNADPRLGTVTKNEDGTFTYTPSVYSIGRAAAGAAETDTVTLTLDDGHGGQVSVPVAIDIGPVVVGSLSISAGGNLEIQTTTIDTSVLTDPDAELEVTGLELFIRRVGGKLILEKDGQVIYDFGSASNADSIELVTSGGKTYVYAQSVLMTIIDLGTE